MKKISDMFTDEEKKHLSYLGSMLRREPTEEEKETQRILDWFVDNKDKFKDGKLIEPNWVFITTPARGGTERRSKTNS
jgi:hypothetical protein